MHQWNDFYKFITELVSGASYQDFIETERSIVSYIIGYYGSIKRINIITVRAQVRLEEYIEMPLNSGQI
jgi:hypothetical protein